MNKVHVKLGDRSYSIAIKDGILEAAGELIASLSVSRNAVVISNTTVTPIYLSRLKKILKNAGFNNNEIIIPDGERFKNLKQIERIYLQLLSFDLDRKSLIIALGGGVVGDIAGFAAATFLRGVPFVQIPTTLLAQVDSSVGGKTGINLPGGKNLVGAFYQPSIVIIDPLVLSTLEHSEIQSGMGEVIKYAIIKDRSFFNFLRKNVEKALKLDSRMTTAVIKKCCSIKADIVSKDETESGMRAFLNFGHTIGHAVETLTKYRKYKHGEAVAIGMVAAARLSYVWGHCSEKDYERVKELLQMSGLPCNLPRYTAAEYTEIIMKDKKKSGDFIQMVLMKKIGEVFVDRILPDRITQALRNYFNLK